MISPHDDLPIHQTPAPIAHPATGDPNHYDRFFFNGYDPDGGYFFALAMGLYPNRGVIDAAFSVVRDGVQRSVFASGPIPRDRSQTTIGPITVELTEPLRVNRISVQAPDQGLEAELRYEARTPAVEEPRQRIEDRFRTPMDYTRVTQLGCWEGSLRSGDVEINVPAGTPGTKDRSWGIRPVGEPVPGAPSSVFSSLYFLWTPIHLGDEGLFLALFEHADGNRWYCRGARAEMLTPGAATCTDEGITHLDGVDYDIDFEPGTRRSRSASFAYRFGDEVLEAKLEPLLTFPMQGIGYHHPTFGHGYYHGPEVRVEGATWDLNAEDPLHPLNLHVEQVVRVTVGDRVGVGTFEQMIIGPHRPSGFTDLFDGAPA